MSTKLTICLSCQQGRGKDLFDLISAQYSAEKNGGSVEKNGAEISVEGFDCLWSCSAACSVQLKAAGKMGYHMGGFEAHGQDAAALLDFVEKYDRSPSGEVAFSDWPNGIKGHFIARITPSKA